MSSPKDKERSQFRFKGQKPDGTIVESNNIEDFELQDFIWFQETETMTAEKVKKMYGKLYKKYLSKSHAQ